LQELAHDLRTPVASLKNLLETLHLRKQTLSESHREELTDWSLKEVEYFEHLVEDLLFLAQVTEPKYHASKAAVDLTDLLSEELDRVETRSRAIGKNLEIKRLFSAEVTLVGDAHLLRRLLRNGLENAASFARSWISVEIQDGGAEFSVIIQDDGK